MKNKVSEKKIRVLIVDDEVIVREGIRMYLAGETDVEIAGECANGLDAVTAIREKSPDLVFLDVQMPGMDGFAVIETVGVEKMPAVIFVTAYDKYAVRAFEVYALDYVLKPFDKARILKALRRAETATMAAATAAETAAARQENEPNHQLSALIKDLRSELALASTDKPSLKAYQERLVIKKAGRIFFMNVEEIDWVEAAENYVKLHAGHESHLIRETISGLESKLDPNKFLRVRRTALINIGRVKELQPLFNGAYAIVFRSGAEVTSSRRFRKNIGLLLGE